MKHFFTIILLVGTIGLRAQQYPLFSNYLTNCFGFNPAVTGIQEGLEGRLMYRSQWTGFKQAPETSLANLNARLGKLPIGVGGTFYKDAAGRLERQGGALSLAIHQNLGKNTAASIGASLGYFNNRLNKDYFANDNSDSFLAGAVDGQKAPDVNVGVYVKHKEFYAGASAPQFLQRVLKFKDANDPNAQNESVLQRHYFVFAGYRHYLGKMYVEPSALLKMTKTAPTQWDAGLKFGTGTPLWLGASYRNKAAGAVMAGLDLKNGLGLAYAVDLTTTKLSKASVTSHEVTLIYRRNKCKDKDKDGICDKEDKCPEEPGAEANEGCPAKDEDEKCKDRDADKICDADDECPDVPGTKENKGCPINDRDKDGIPDDKDKCPDVPGFKQFEGCPMNDRDNDGIRDDLDKCPDEAGPVANIGCPQSQGDIDGDGIPDDLDQCPNTGGKKEKNGCPTISPEEQMALELAIQNLYFKTDKWDMTGTSKSHLNRLAKVMTNQRDWKVRIAGHADSRGTNEHNLMLSKNRAEAVMYYLMSKGVKREQLVVEYYGEAIPLGDNKSAEGWAENRRVEMEFIFN